MSSRSFRRWWIALGVAVAIPIVVLLVAHTPVVRSMLRDRVVRALADAGMDATVDELRYNLLTLDVELRNVRLAARGQGDAPFLAAERLRLRLPWGVLSGLDRLHLVEIEGARISIVRDAGGELNLPAAAAGDSAGAEVSLPAIERLSASRVTLSYRDLAGDVEVGLEELELRLDRAPGLDRPPGAAGDRRAPSGAAAGPLRLEGSGRIRWAERLVEVEELAGTVVYDGAGLRVDELQLETRPARLSVSGSLRPLGGATRIDATVAGSLRGAPIAVLLGREGAAEGVLTLAGEVQGPLADPTASLRLTGSGLRALEVDIDDLDVEAEVSTRQVAIRRLEAGALGARWQGEGRLSIAGGAHEGRARLAWNDLDATRLGAFLETDFAALPAATADGEAEATWTALRLEDLELHASTTARPAAAAERRVPVGGRLRLDLAAGGWRLEAEQTWAGALDVAATLAGDLVGDDLPASTLTGELRLDTEDLAAVQRRLEVAGLLPAALDGAAGQRREAPAPQRLQGRARARVQVGGTLRRPRADAILSASELRFVSGARDPGELEARFAVDDELLEVTAANLRVGDSRLQVGGRLAWSDGSLLGDYEVHVPDLAGLVGWLPAELAPQVGRGSLQARGGLAGTLQAPETELELVGNGLVLDGARAASITATIGVRGPLDDPAGEIEAEVTDLHIGELMAGRAHVEASLRGGVLEVGAALPELGSRLDARLGVLPLDDYEVEADVQRLPIETLLERLTVVSPAARGDAEGRTRPAVSELSGLVSLGVRVRGSLRRPAGAVAPVAGALSNVAAATLELRELDATVADTPVRLEQAGRIDYDESGLRAEPVTVSIGGAHVRVGGRLGRDRTGEISASLDGDLADFDDLVRVGRALGSGIEPPAGTVPEEVATEDEARAPAGADEGRPAAREAAAAAEVQEPAAAEGLADAVLRLSGSVHAELTLAGSLDQPRARGLVDVEGGRIGLDAAPPVTDVGLDAVLDGGVVELQRATARWQETELSASGSLPLRLFEEWLPAPLLAGAPAGEAVLEAHATPITMEALRPFVDPELLEQVSGTVEAQLSLRAGAPRLEAVRGELRLATAELVLAGVRLVQRVPTRVELSDGTLRVAEWRWGGPPGDVTVSGEVRLLETPAALDLRLDGVADLRVLRPLLPDVATAGRATVAIAVRGSLERPVADGSIRLEAAELRIAEPRLAITDAEGAILLTPTRIAVEEIAGLLNGGTFRLAGEASIEGGEVRRGGLALEARQVALELPEGLRTLVDADLALDLAPQPMTLRGTVTVLRGAYRQPLSLTAELLDALGQASRPAGAPTPFDDLRLDVRLFTAEDVVVDNNLARAALGADLRLGGTLAQPSLSGRAELREGGEVFLTGNRFHLETGTIDFVDAAGIVPDVDITAQTRVADYDIVLEISGTPDDLLVTPRSVPDLPQADVMSLLITGRTLEDVSTVPAQVAQEQAIVLLTGELSSRAGRAIGVDSIRLERTTASRDLLFNPVAIATETDPTARLTISKQLRSDLELVFSQALSESGGFTWIVSYRLLRSVRLRTLSDDRNDRAYELAQDLSFGGGVPPPSTTTPSGRQERVRSVVFEAGPFAAEELADRVPLDEGDRFDFFRWQEGRDRLERFAQERGHLEARVRTDRRVVDEAGGRTWLQVTYRMEAGPRTTLQVDGYELSASTRRAMRTAWSRSVFDEFLLDELAAAARAELAGAGHVRAAIEARVAEDSGADKRIVVRIEPGPRVSERRIEFQGNERIPPQRLREWIDEAGLRLRAWAEPAAVEEALATLYREEGMLDAAIEVEEPRIDGNVGRLPVRIEEGPLYRVAEIVLVGAAARPESTVRTDLGLRPGEVFSPGRARRAGRDLEAVYRTEGFADVRVRLQQEAGPGSGDVRVVYTVDEGRRQVLDDVVVEGAARTRRSVVERSLQIESGEPVDPGSLLRSRRNLYDTGVFRRVDIDIEPLADEEAGQAAAGVQPVRARVRVEERPRFRFRYGLRLRDESAPLGESGRDLKIGLSSDFADHNLLGRAISAGVAARWQTDFRAVRGFVSLPSFFGLPVTTSGFVLRSREEVGQEPFNPFVTDVTGVALEQRLRPFDQVQVAYGYSFERNRTFEKDFDPNDPFAFDLTIHIARLRLTGVADTRDDVFDTIRGWFHSSSFEYSTPGLGSDLSFAKYLLQQTWFQPLLDGDVVLASAARVGLASAFEQELIPSERFFAGGGNSVRGYEEDSLGPRNFFGDPTGGEALLVLKQEVRFPLVWRFRGVGFVDAGNAFATIGDISLSGLKSSAGFGLRVDTPFVLLRIDYGFRLGRDPGDPLGGFFFSIGQAF